MIYVVVFFFDLGFYLWKILFDWFWLYLNELIVFYICVFVVIYLIVYKEIIKKRCLNGGRCMLKELFVLVKVVIKC